MLATLAREAAPLRTNQTHGSYRLQPGHPLFNVSAEGSKQPGRPAFRVNASRPCQGRGDPDLDPWMAAAKRAFSLVA